MFKVLLLAVAAAFSFAGAAQASTLYVTLGATNTASVSGIDLYSVANILAGSTSGSSGEVGVATANYAGATRPSGNLFNNEYLYVNGNSDRTSWATYALSSNIFGFTWGTIDSEENEMDTNILTLSDDQKIDYTITGDDLWSLINSIAFQTSDGQVDVLFYNPAATFVQAMLSSNKVSFEAANLTSAVPLPGAALLFGSGLAALAGVARRKIRR